MQLLVVAATEFELSAARERLRGVAGVDFATTGVGMLPTAYCLTRLLARKGYDWVFSVGIAGALADVALGEAVVVAREAVADCGVETATGAVQPLPPALQSSVALTCPYVHDFPLLQHVKKVAGVTVNLLTENATRVAARRAAAEVETMEGAAFFYVCLREGVSFLQLRGISNRVGVRDKQLWRTAEALDSVGSLLTLALRGLQLTINHS